MLTVNVLISQATLKKILLINLRNIMKFHISSYSSCSLFSFFSENESHHYLHSQGLKETNPIKTTLIFPRLLLTSRVKVSASRNNTIEEPTQLKNYYVLSPFKFLIPRITPNFSLHFEKTFQIEGQRN